MKKKPAAFSTIKRPPHIVIYSKRVFIKKGLEWFVDSLVDLLNFALETLGHKKTMEHELLS